MAQHARLHHEKGLVCYTNDILSPAQPHESYPTRYTLTSGCHPLSAPFALVRRVGDPSCKSKSQSLTKKQRRSKQFMTNWEARYQPFQPATDVHWFQYNPVPPSIPCSEWLFQMRVPFTLSVSHLSSVTNDPPLRGKPIPNLTTLVLHMNRDAHDLHTLIPAHPNLTRLIIRGAQRVPTLAEWRASGLTQLSEYTTDRTYVEACRSGDIGLLTQLKKRWFRDTLQGHLLHRCAVRYDCAN